jgi:hypothetical protein
MKAFYLNRQVFACVEGDFIVLLDLNKDKYLCISRESLCGVEESIVGLSNALGRPAMHRDVRQEGVEPILRQMAGAQLITQSEAQGKAFSLTTISEARRSMIDPTLPSSRARLLDVTRFFTSAISANIQLKSRPLNAIVARVLRRRALNTSDIAPPTIDRWLDRINCFHSLRPRFPRAYLCLFDSLAMIEFLARHKVYPNWVFGVQLRPFHAHCWLQFEDAVLNDSVEHVRRYTPIMIV